MPFGKRGLQLGQSLPHANHDVLGVGAPQANDQTLDRLPGALAA